MYNIDTYGGYKKHQEEYIKNIYSHILSRKTLTAIFNKVNFLTGFSFNPTNCLKIFKIF